MLRISTPPPFGYIKRNRWGPGSVCASIIDTIRNPVFPPFLWGEGGAASEINADFILTWFLAGSPMSLSVSVKAT